MRNGEKANVKAMLNIHGLIAQFVSLLGPSKNKQYTPSASTPVSTRSVRGGRVSLKSFVFLSELYREVEKGYFDIKSLVSLLS